MCAAKINKPTLNLDEIKSSVFAIAYDEKIGRNAKHHHTHGQLFYCASGSITFETDAMMTILPPTQAVWIPPNIPHTGYSNGKVSYRSIYFDEQLCRSLPKEIHLLHVSELMKQVILEICGYEMDEELSRTQNRITKVLIDLINQADIQQLSLLISRDGQVLKIMQYLQDKNANVSSEAIANKFGLSPRTLSRKFIEHTGMNFQQWCQQLRLIIAIDLLANNKSISYISDKLGYSSESAFIHMFTQKMKVSPHKYRNLSN